MAHVNLNGNFTHKLVSRDVIVVGAGPVGLVASLLLSKYQVAHLLVEQLTEPDTHPQAHFLNCRTMEVLRELDDLNLVVRSQSAPADDWRRFVYCTNLSELPSIDRIKSSSESSLLGVVDHFDDVTVDDERSPDQVAHFPQPDFVRLLRANALKSKFCHFLEGRQADVREYPDNVKVILTNRRTNRCRETRARFVVAADGAHSLTRKKLGIKMIGESSTLQHLINIHFFSSQLAEWMRSRIPAMLYFVYSRAGVAVLVAHALNRGEFVAQIPIFPPHQRLKDYDDKQCTELLQKIAGRPFSIDIRSIRSWRMGIWEASRFRSKWGRCFLVGDAAHQLTPAGGFGMNTGIQDAHNLIWKIAMALRCGYKEPFESADHLLESYEDERRPIARRNAKISVRNFEISLRVPKAIGLDLQTANRLSRLIERIPGPCTIKRAVFRASMRLGLKQVDWLKAKHAIARRRRLALHNIFQDAKQQTLQLLFPGQDLGIVYRKGWLSGQDEAAAIRLDPFDYKPVLQTGGRMPHFWLENEHGLRISVLDLPSLMIGPEGMPLYVKLMDGDGEIFPKDFEAIEDMMFRPAAIVKIGSLSNVHSKVHFSFYPKRPEFLSRNFVVLMRPDGHIAWLQN